MMTFAVGEKVVYPNQGVGTIENISTRYFEQRPEKFYLLRLFCSSMTVMVPFTNAETIGLRKLSKTTDVTKVLADGRVNILSASVTTTRDRVAVSRFSFEMGDPKHLGHVLRAVRNIEGVYDVYRVTSSN